MRLDPDARQYVFLDITVSTDPAAATAEVELDDSGVWTAWVWDAAAVDNGDGTWTRTAKRLFAGPDADPGSAQVLTGGRHLVKWRLVGLVPEIPAEPADPIDVV